MEGEVYFVWLCTNGQREVPYLPQELRRKIYYHTYPRTKKRCAECDNVVLLESVGRSYFQVRPYTMIGNACVCMTCLEKDTSKKKVSIESFVSRRGFIWGVVASTIIRRFMMFVSTLMYTMLTNSFFSKGEAIP